MAKWMRLLLALSLLFGILAVQGPSRPAGASSSSVPRFVVFEGFYSLE